MSDNIKYKRVLIKLSGEALAGEQGFGINPDTVHLICKELGTVLSYGVQMALVIGGGNIFRGLSGFLQSDTMKSLCHAECRYAY